MKRYFSALILLACVVSLFLVCAVGCQSQPAVSERPQHDTTDATYQTADGAKWIGGCVVTPVEAK